MFISKFVTSRNQHYPSVSIRLVPNFARVAGIIRWHQWLTGKITPTLSFPLPSGLSAATSDHANAAATPQQNYLERWLENMFCANIQYTPSNRHLGTHRPFFDNNRWVLSLHGPKSGGILERFHVGLAQHSNGDEWVNPLIDVLNPPPYL